MTPVVCMITDRLRLGGDAADQLVGRVYAAARAGVHLVQVRERDLEGGPLARLVAACVAAVRGTATRVLVNDRLDVALAAGAHGVHLRGDSMPAARLRHLVRPGFLVGRSVHSAAEAAARTEEGGLDYLMFGSVFVTATKPGHRAAGVGALAEVASATPLPVLAVGGASLERVPALASAGAAGLAAIGLFSDPPVEQLAVVVAQVSAAFDSPRRLS